MEKITFNKITKEVFLKYGFIKNKNRYILSLDDVTIVVKFCSWRGIKSFDYYFFINALYDDTIPLEKRFDTMFELKMEHTPTLRGYHAHEILLDSYDETAYRKMLTNMLHQHFDSYKKNALQFIKDNHISLCLTKKAEQYLGIERC